MADSAREQKLAAARKKLRKFQKKKVVDRANNDNSKESSPDLECFSENGTISSTASSIDLTEEVLEENIQETINLHKDTENSSNSEFASNMETITEKSDAIDNEHLPVTPDVRSNVLLDQNDLVGNDSSIPEVSSKNCNIETQANFTTESIEEQKDLPVSALEGTLTVPPVSQTANMIVTDDHLPNNNENLLVTSIENPVNGVVDQVQQESSNESGLQINISTDISTSSDSIDNKSDINTKEDIDQIPMVVNTAQISDDYLNKKIENFDAKADSTDSFVGEGTESLESASTTSIITAIQGRNGAPLKSSTESLRQLSLQLSGLVNHSSDDDASDAVISRIEDLEKRNRELAALLQEEKQACQQQTLQILSLKEQLAAVPDDTMPEGEKLEQREIQGLREQLQVHIQTIGILVAEKSELQSALTHAKHTLQQNQGSSTDLHGRLSASRQRVCDLEGEIRDLTAKLDSSAASHETQLKEIDALKMNQFKQSKINEDLKASVAELTERLSVKTEEYEKHNTILSEVKKKLAMSQLHIEQLRDGNNEELERRFESVQASYIEEQNQRQGLQEKLSAAQIEMKQTIAQYQTYTMQLTNNNQQITQQVQTLSLEKEEVLKKLANCESVIATLEEEKKKALDSEKIQAELSDLKNTVNSLAADKEELQQKNTTLTNDNNQLSRLVEELRQQMESYEMNEVRTKTDEVDTAQLLATMQSDKVAAARALTQNKELKQQLEELQNGFISMSNKKLELTEKLESELHAKKTLNEEIASVNQEIHQLKEEIIIRDREIVSLKEVGESLGKQLLDMRNHLATQAQGNMNNNEIKENGLSDDEEHSDHSVLSEEIEMIKQQYHQSQNRVTELETQIQELQKTPSLLEDSSQLHVNGVNNEVDNEVEVEHDESSTDVSIDNIDQLPCVHGETQKTEINENIKTDGEMLSLRNAYNALEDRFKRSMDQVAQLTEDKTSLEHTIQQLEMETEAVGDYITIYQFQRGVLKQKIREHEDQLTSLLNEREEMRIKLSSLQELVSTLRVNGNGPNVLADFDEIISPKASVLPKESEAVNEENDVDSNQSLEAIKDKNVEDLDKVESEKVVAENLTNSPEDHEELSSPNKSATVQRILDLINEMESTGQTDCLTGHKNIHCHKCGQCSGQLIAV